MRYPDLCTILGTCCTQTLAGKQTEDHYQAATAWSAENVLKTHNVITLSNQ
jgi:hypothetical protein